MGVEHLFYFQFSHVVIYCSVLSVLYSRPGGQTTFPLPVVPAVSRAEVVPGRAQPHCDSSESALPVSTSFSTRRKPVLQAEQSQLACHAPILCSLLLFGAQP